MNKDKQIEEMSPQEIKELVDLLVDYGRNYDDSIRGCEDIVAELIVTNGYRKASEVAREIFEEIENLMNEVYSSVQYGCYSFGMTKHIDTPDAMRQMGKLEGVKHLGNAIAEIKKKYTEGGE